MTRALKLATFAIALLCVPVTAQLNIPDIPYDAVDPLKLPDDLYLGEAAGVATNSKGNVFVYTRTGNPSSTLGTRRTFSHGGSRLFEFDPSGKFIREIGQGLYGFLVAHTVRVDREDNIWVVDEGSNMVIKFDREGRLLMTMGRKPEAIPVPPPTPAPAPAAPASGRGGGEDGGGGRGRGAGPAAPAGPPQPQGTGVPGDNFNRPTDVAWDAAGNIYVADGTGNSRIAKFDRNGKYLKSWGSRGTAPGQFNVPHTIAIDAQGLVYVGDRSNNRIQVFDGEGTFKAQFVNVGAPAAICITPGPRQFLYSSNSNPSDSMDNGEIYKMTLDGKIVGKFGTAGKLLKEFGTVHGMDCRSENELYVGEMTNWRVQKLTLKPR
jgi:DNA-binding beta-propeller fold protein YncE